MTLTLCYIHGVDKSLDIVYIHTCTIPRNIPLDNAVAILHNAKNGDASITVSAARKAGNVVGKMAPKDIAFGPKNPARRMKKFWDLPLEKQQQMFGNDLGAVLEEYKAYEASLLALATGGVKAKEWVADTVKQSISDLFDIVNTAEGCHNILKMRVETMDNATAVSRKDKQAVERNNRGDVRRLLKPWEVTKLPTVWRHELHTNCLTRDDIVEDIADEHAYLKYVASQPPIATAKPLLSDWAKPMWFEDNVIGVGARFMIVGSSFVMLFKYVVMQSCIG